MLHSKYLIALSILILFLSSPCFAQESDIEILVDEQGNEFEMIPISGAIEMEAEDMAALIRAASEMIEMHTYELENKQPKEIREVYSSLLLDYAAYLKKGLKVKEEVIDETNAHSSAMSYLVIIILVVGFIAALMEFIHAYKMRNKANRADIEHSIEIGLQNIAIKSTLTGLVLFVITIALYMIYVTNVLPIQLV